MKNLIKNFTAGVIVTAIILTCFTACGSKTPTDLESSSEITSTEETTSTESEKTSDITESSTPESSGESTSSSSTILSKPKDNSSSTSKPSKPQPPSEPPSDWGEPPPNEPIVPPTPPNIDISGYSNEVIRLINSEREKMGLEKLTVNSILMQGANIRAKELATLYSHTRPNGESPSSVFPDVFDWPEISENIVQAGWGYTPSQAVTSWMNSSGHRAAMLNSNYKYIGVGVYLENGVINFQMFAGILKSDYEVNLQAGDY
ncbi:MAG: CAP domain-containing protein [Oscillospiraceae bacterium]|nr:CAP domain-containing protein [Oscillospiraceae bacterium]